MSRPTTPDETVWVLDHPPTEQRWPVYHTSPACQMVVAYPSDYLEVPMWVVAKTDIRPCAHHGACQS